MFVSNRKKVVWRRQKRSSDESAGDIEDTVAAINVVLNSNAPIMSNWTLQNMEAFTDESSTEGINWSSLKLKQVICVCPTSGANGYSNRCRVDGNLEHCSITQQGLSGCYSTTIISNVYLLCEGAGIVYGE
jgi:hypothetical protein